MIADGVFKSRGKQVIIHPDQAVSVTSKDTALQGLPGVTSAIFEERQYKAMSPRLAGPSKGPRHMLQPALQPHSYTQLEGQQKLAQIKENRNTRLTQFTSLPLSAPPPPAHPSFDLPPRQGSRPELLQRHIT